MVAIFLGAPCQIVLKRQLTAVKDGAEKEAAVEATAVEKVEVVK